MESSGTGRTWFWLACADSSRTFWREARPPRSEDFRLAIFALGKRTLMGDMGQLATRLAVPAPRWKAGRCRKWGGENDDTQSPKKNTQQH